MAPLACGFDARSIAERESVRKWFRGYDLAVRVTLVLIGILLVGSGLVWMAQGFNLSFAPRSFMTADRSWILIGAIAVVAGAVLLAWARQRE